uniref:neural proliferation differentiation and control protein 1-like n=1 Tax=Pristiophorus japonicus TaxID=55135 RepID=UPI00398E737F
MTSFFAAVAPLHQLALLPGAVSAKDQVHPVAPSYVPRRLIFNCWRLQANPGGVGNPHFSVEKVQIKMHGEFQPYWEMEYAVCLVHFKLTMDSVRHNLSSCSLCVCLLFIFSGLSDSASQCPRRLDCALRRRNPCPSGSHDCGPCLPHYQEDDEGKCMRAGRRRHGGSPISERPDDVAGLIHVLLAQGEKLAATAATDREMYTTRSWPRLSPTYTREATSPGHTPGPAQSTEEPQATARSTARSHRGPDKERRKEPSRLLNDVVSLSLVIICTVMGFFGLVVAGLCWYRLQKEVRLVQKMAYEGNKKPLPQPRDGKFAKKLQRNHYQHQKKVIQAMEEGESKARMKQMSTESEAENENGEYTVYECPGLAPTGEMEIHNPLFDSSFLRGGSSDKQN